MLYNTYLFFKCTHLLHKTKHSHYHSWQSGLFIISHMKSSRFHEIHLKPVRTTHSSEILHFLLAFHMESSEFHTKSIKYTNEIHNEIHTLKYGGFHMKSSRKFTNEIHSEILVKSVIEICWIT